MNSQNKNKVIDKKRRVDSGVDERNGQMDKWTDDGLRD